MPTLLVLFLAASHVATPQVLYMARVATFGCTSREAVTQLQQLRAQPRVFQQALYTQVFQGQCVAIAKGKLVEVSADSGDAALLLVDRQVEPPGYMAPARDFKIRR